MPDVTRVWDEPEIGLTEADFARWPARRTFKRSKSHGRDLTAGFDAGRLTFPVYLVGECTTYDMAHAHPSFPAARHDNVFFAVSGEPGTPWARVTTFRKKPELLPEFDHVDLERVELFPAIGYVDLQLSHRGTRVARIGFSYFKDSPALALKQADAVAEAVLTCRSGALPNQ